MQIAAVLLYGLPIEPHQKLRVPGPGGKLMDGWVREWRSQGSAALNSRACQKIKKIETMWVCGFSLTHINNVICLNRSGSNPIVTHFVLPTFPKSYVSRTTASVILSCKSSFRLATSANNCSSLCNELLEGKGESIRKKWGSFSRTQEMQNIEGHRS